MLEKIPSNWKADISGNITSDIRAFFSPRGITYYPLNSQNPFKYKYRPNGAGCFSAYGGTADYFVDLYSSGFVIDVQYSNPSKDWLTLIEFPCTSGSNTGFRLDVKYGSVKAGIDDLSEYVEATNYETTSRATLVAEDGTFRLYIDGTLKDTDTYSIYGWYLPLLQLDCSTCEVHRLEIFNADGITDADVLNGFKNIRAESAVWDFNGNGCGYSRVNITEYMKSFFVARESFSEARCSITLKNENGEFTDNIYAAYNPLVGSFNGASDQRYLQGRVKFWLETHYIGDAPLYPSETLYPSTTLYPYKPETCCEYLYIGTSSAGGFATRAMAGDTGLVTVELTDAMGLMRSKVSRTGFVLEDEKLIADPVVSGVFDPTEWNSSVLHKLLRQASQYELYNLLGGTNTASVTGFLWNTSGVTVTTGTRNTYDIATSGYMYQTITYSPTAGEEFTAGCLALATGSNTIKIRIEEFIGSTATGNYTESTATGTGGEYSYLDCVHTVVSNTATRLRVTYSSTGGGSMRYPFLTFGRSPRAFCDNSDTDVERATTNMAIQEVDSMGILADGSTYTHRFAFIKPGQNLYDEIGKIAESCRARACCVNSSGVFEIRLGVDTGTLYTLTTSGSGIVAVDQTLPLDINNLSVLGSQINKATEVEQIASINTSSWVDERGRIGGVTVAPDGYWPESGYLEVPYTTETTVRG